MKSLKTYLQVLSICLGIQSLSAQSPVDYVNMRIGTDGANPTEYGGTVPAVSSPFGMTQWCAATRTNGISRTMYHNRDTTLIGFMATHQPAIWMGDYGFMTLMPQTGKLKLKTKERKVRLDRTKETTTPYYYKVAYNDGANPSLPITTELTATSRASFFHINYPKQEKALLYLEAGRNGAGGGIRILPEKREIHIYNQEVHDAHLGPKEPGIKGYYVLTFSVPFNEYGTWNDTTVVKHGTQAAASSVGGYVVFPANTTLVDVRIGSSFIGFEQAAVNLSKEIPAQASFQSIVAKNKKTWNESLSKITLDGASKDDMHIFYTAFFHTLQFPREFSEYGRYYSPFDGKVHQGVSYNAYSLWDTFRAEHPWLQWMAPERVNDMVASLVQMYEEGGWIPKWPNPTYTSIMIGTHADAVIADAYVNGFRGYNTQKAYEAIRKNAYTAPVGDEKHNWGDRAHWNGHYEARGGLTNYIKKGYVASDKTSEAVARTLEFALDDYCIAQMADSMGYKQDYADLMKRSHYYSNLFNKTTKCFQARKEDGTWDGKEVGFTEGANWTYQFCVMQDVPGLIDLMGGKTDFVSALDFVFDHNHYRHDNEPCHHYVYMYNYCDRLDITQKRLPTILANDYKNAPDGLSGNDDCGQMSAWYLFSSLGFYPVTPASGQYALGIPRFKQIHIQLPGKRKLTIRAKGVGKKAVLKDIRLNGEKITTPFIEVKKLWQGGVLEFL